MPRLKGSKNITNSTNVFLWIPRRFDVKDFPDLEGHEDSAHWLLHKVVTGTVWQRHNPYYDGMTPISRQTMKQHIQHKDVARVRSALVGKVLEVNESYRISTAKETGYSQSYGLSENYGDGLRRVEVKSRALANRIRADRINRALEDVRPGTLEATHAWLLDCLRKVKIDTTAAYKTIEQLPDEKPRIKKNRVGKKGRKRIVKVALPTPKETCRMTVDKIARQELDFKPCPYGRIHTPHTRLLTECRAALSIDGRKLGSIDIANSQVVFLLTLLLRDRFLKASYYAQSRRGDLQPAYPASPTSAPIQSPNGPYPASSLSSFLQSPEVHSLRGIIYSSSPSSDSPSKALYDHDGRGREGGVGGDEALQPDERQFRDDVLSGVLYNRLMDMTGIMDRKVFKGKFFEAVLYGDNSKWYSYTSPITKAFRFRYPNVWTWIVQRKQPKGLDDPKEAFKELARDMQRAESSLVIGAVCERLAAYHAEIVVVSIHDSLMALPEHLPLIERIMREEFARIGVVPSFKVEQPDHSR